MKRQVVSKKISLPTCFCKLTKKMDKINMKTIKVVALIFLAVVMALIAVNFKVMLMLGGNLGIAVSALCAVAFILSIVVILHLIFKKETA